MLLYLLLVKQKSVWTKILIIVCPKHHHQWSTWKRLKHPIKRANNWSECLTGEWECWLLWEGVIGHSPNSCIYLALTTLYCCHVATIISPSFCSVTDTISLPLLVLFCHRILFLDWMSYEELVFCVSIFEKGKWIIPVVIKPDTLNYDLRTGPDSNVTTT